jgi:hypothetical protein
MTTPRLTLQQRTALRSLRQFPAALAPLVMWAQPPTPRAHETTETSPTTTPDEGIAPSGIDQNRGSSKAARLNTGVLG